MARCIKDKAAENGDLRNTTSLFMGIAFAAKLLLRKCHVHLELVVLELAQRTLSLISKAQKSKEEEEVNQRSVPRTISFGSDHRGHCTVTFLHHLSVRSVLTFTRGASGIKHSVR